MAKVSVGFVDYNREGSTVSLRVAEPDVSGLPGTAGAAIQDMEQAVNNLANALNAVSLGLNTSIRATYRENILAAPTAAASSTNAQRERKWLVRYFDSVTFDSGTFEIPAADLSLLQANSDYMNIESGAGSDLVAAIEGYVISKQGNPVEVVEILHVGRNT